MTADVEVCGERLVLRPDRSLFWPRTRTLVVADPHFGKAEAFRAAGVPVPGGTESPLARLAAALEETVAGRLVVLGDFWHSRDGRTDRVADELAAWRAGSLQNQCDWRSSSAPRGSRASAGRASQSAASSTARPASRPGRSSSSVSSRSSSTASRGKAGSRAGGGGA